jgi:dolichyl-phosphate-mannose-protein mannosyltransferase
MRGTLTLQITVSKDVEKVNYKKIGFLGKFIEINVVMWQKNARLTSSHPYESRPEGWPLLRRPISFWSKHHRHVHLVGNPFIWWSSTLAIGLWVVAKIILMLRAKRGYMDHLNCKSCGRQFMFGFSTMVHQT